jgi:hypothetical protein
VFVSSAQRGLKPQQTVAKTIPSKMGSYWESKGQLMKTETLRLTGPAFVFFFFPVFLFVFPPGILTS